MKVFISWSGELSKHTAAALHEWLPVLMDNIDVFYSRDDIERGENWDQRISSELADCSFGLVCLTPENISAPWVNFEAGAIAKTLDSRLAALLIGLNPSELKGPISRFQATKIEKEEFLQLVKTLNNKSESPIEQNVLEQRFNMSYPHFEEKIQTLISEHSGATKGNKKTSDKTNAEAIEEILQLVRKQNTILNQPESLLPQSYLLGILNNRALSPDRLSGKDEGTSIDNYRRELFYQIHNYLRFLDRWCDSLNSSERKIIRDIHISEFIKRISVGLGEEENTYIADRLDMLEKVLMVDNKRDN